MLLNLLMGCNLNSCKMFDCSNLYPERSSHTNLKASPRGKGRVQILYMNKCFKCDYLPGQLISAVS